jgi:hypothetical protein
VEDMIDVVYAWFSEEWGEEIPKCKRCLKKLKTNKPLSSRVVYSSNPSFPTTWERRQLKRTNST